MSDDYQITVADDWSAWPEDLDPAKAADQLTPLLPDDPVESLIQMLRTLPTIIGAAPTPIMDSSQMAADRDAARGLLDLPMQCHNYLAGSADFLKGFYRIMRPRPNILEIPRFAAYPLARGVIESSGQTVWVLSPAKQRDRFVRLLQLEKAEADQDRKYIKTATALHDNDTHEKRSEIAKVQANANDARHLRLKRLDEAASALGIDRKEFEGGLPGGYDAVIGQALADSHEYDSDDQTIGTESYWTGRFGASVWTFISGLSHPSMSRGWAGSIHELGKIGADGYREVKTSANPMIIRDALAVALRLHMRALRLWAQACSAP
ncbi:Uncharacterised protein [Mycobacteroides abscessus subsp. abscessus]|uniref:hypothetical protein n=1 Tax=Mycobacteroides abscessus TaxID=36809 RepID=UPI000929A095|nr:hypothetical protein [Mycobacteroides abscessus]SIK94712.1 Uncharacterised protein [Mycobacteroides abscessus subsp. abscessus]SLC90195.1 Uncharacterised protein [Mycobacteroides abscessus subsp. abscessus]